MVVGECSTLEMDTTSTDLKGCATSVVSSEVGCSLSNGPGRKTDVAVELRSGCVGVGAGNGISNDDKATAEVGDLAIDGGRRVGVVNNEAQAFADHGMKI